MFFLADPSASIPEGVNPVDVAALMKYYLASLPTPLTTFELYNEIKDARSSVNRMRKSLQKLSSVNYNTLEFVTALLLRVSQKSQLNKVGVSCIYNHFNISYKFNTCLFVQRIYIYALVENRFLALGTDGFTQPSYGDGSGDHMARGEET